MLFNQFLKNQKKEQKKTKEDNLILLESIISEISDILENRAVNWYQMMDILNILQGRTNQKIADMLKGNHKRIDDLMHENSNLKDEINTRDNDLIDQNDTEQSTKDTEQEIAQ